MKKYMNITCDDDNNKEQNNINNSINKDMNNDDTCWILGGDQQESRKKNKNFKHHNHNNHNNHATVSSENSLLNHSYFDSSSIVASSPPPPSPHSITFHSSTEVMNPLRLSKSELSLMEKNRLRMGSKQEDYKFYAVIGKGSYGTVWKAKSKHTQQVVAIKTLDKRTIKGNGMLHHVRSEVIIHLKMKHENIVELYHFFEDNNTIYMVMEYCKDNMLYHLQSKKRFSERRTRKYMRDVISGLDHLQSCLVLHRDLKLANLLLTSEKRVKISDFGLSRYVSPNEECATQLGTPKYMAYEVVLQRPYSQKADNWSLGCIMFAMLAGQTPFHRDTETVEETFRLIQNLDYEIPDYFSPEAKDLISKLLQSDPSKRLSLQDVMNHKFFRNTKSVKSNPVQVIPAKQPIASITGSICTDNLKPMKHTTREGLEVEIRNNGQVHLRYNQVQFTVSPDGQHVWYNNDNSNNRREYHCLVSSLPNYLTGWYDYLYQFVNLVKSKTPICTFSTLRNQCMLMQNEPLPDAEMIYFVDCIRIVYIRNSRSLLVFDETGALKSKFQLETDLTNMSEEDIYRLPNCSHKLQNCLAELRFGIDQCQAMLLDNSRKRRISTSLISNTTTSSSYMVGAESSISSFSSSTPLNSTITSSVLDVST